MNGSVVFGVICGTLDNVSEKGDRMVQTEEARRRTILLSRLGTKASSSSKKTMHVPLKTP